MPTLRQTFETQLHNLEQDLLRMGAVVLDMLDKAIRALTEQNPALAEEVIRQDDIADALDLSIELACMRLLALQQPMSKDLRTIGSVLKAITDIERIGDFSVDIAKSAIQLSGSPYFQPLEVIPKMGELVKAMIRDTLDAFVNRDLNEVMRICTEADDEVDHIYRSLFNELLEYMQKDPKMVVQSTYLLMVAHYLERAADHTTNVAERIYYMETGELRELA